MTYLARWEFQQLMRQFCTILMALTFFAGAKPVWALDADRNKSMHYDDKDGKSQQNSSAHWAFSPIRQPPLPRADNPVPDANPIDRFILASLHSKGLAAAPEADRRRLIRRVTLDLIGLPPTNYESEAFACDQSPDAFVKVVDRLLADARYGQRWGRLWLDVARYADSKGYVFLEERRYPFSYTYRDYVIRAFNDDLPYDRFILEQLAADKIQGGSDNRSLAALGFLTLGRRFLNNTPDIIDDRIDVTTRGLMGLTVGCARCHDHKFDPIPQRDYYSLYGVFASSVEPHELPLLGNEAPTADTLDFRRQMDHLHAEKERFEKDNAKELKAGNRKFRDQLTGLQKKIDALLVTHPGSPPRAMVLADAPTPVSPHVFLRGNPGTPGESVPRQFLEVIAGKGRKPFTDGSGRLELARAIASPDNPLTARVLVNRVWAWHFGAGLVDTPSDFGIRTTPPSNPQLLDWLAARFMAEGWSIKKLQRWIVLSNTYRQSSIVMDSPAGPSDAIRAARSIDPENRLLWHMNRRRLDFEELRDSLLAVAGQLEANPGGRGVDLFKEPFSRRRSVYGFVDRQNLSDPLRTFDFASPDAHCPARHTTTVPQQALFLMNSPFVQQQAQALARRADARGSAVRIRQIYRFVFARPPSQEEEQLGLEFLGDKPTDDAWTRYAQVLLASNEFMFVD